MEILLINSASSFTLFSDSVILFLFLSFVPFLTDFLIGYSPVYHSLLHFFSHFPPLIFVLGISWSEYSRSTINIQSQITPCIILPMGHSGGAALAADNTA